MYIHLPYGSSKTSARAYWLFVAAFPINIYPNLWRYDLYLTKVFSLIQAQVLLWEPKKTASAIRCVCSLALRERILRREWRGCQRWECEFHSDCLLLLRGAKDSIDKLNTAQLNWQFSGQNSGDLSKHVSIRVLLVASPFHHHFVKHMPTIC